MIASALSMGSGAYLAAKSEREIYQAEFSRERDAVEYDEAEAREVLSLSYQIRGLTTEEADLFAIRGHAPRFGLNFWGLSNGKIRLDNMIGLTYCS